MKSKLLKLTVWVLCPILIVTLPWVGLAKAEPSYDWYFSPNDTHARPTHLSEASFVDADENVLWLGPDQKKIYLTFDAGYDNGNLPKILDTLKEKNISAAFFVDGNFVKNEPELVKRISAEGHILGNHSLSHADMSKLTDFTKYKSEVEGWNERVKAAGGKTSDFFRFPCGRFSRTALEYNKKLGIKSVFWSFAYYDWDTEDQPDRSAALTKILSRTHNGCVMLLHSCSATNAAVLPDVIDRLTLEGYSFGTLTELC